MRTRIMFTLHNDGMGWTRPTNNDMTILEPRQRLQTTGSNDDDASVGSEEHAQGFSPA